MMGTQFQQCYPEVEDKSFKARCPSNSSRWSGQIGRSGEGRGWGGGVAREGEMGTHLRKRFKQDNERDMNGAHLCEFISSHN